MCLHDFAIAEFCIGLCRAGRSRLVFGRPGALLRSVHWGCRSTTQCLPSLLYIDRRHLPPRLNEFRLTQVRIFDTQLSTRPTERYARQAAKPRGDNPAWRKIMWHAGGCESLMRYAECCINVTSAVPRRLQATIRPTMSPLPCCKLAARRSRSPPAP